MFVISHCRELWYKIWPVYWEDNYANLEKKLSFELTMHCNKYKLDHTGDWRIMREDTKYQARCMEHCANRGGQPGYCLSQCCNGKCLTQRYQKMYLRYYLHLLICNYNLISTWCVIKCHATVKLNKYKTKTLWINRKKREAALKEPRLHFFG